MFGSFQHQTNRGEPALVRGSVALRPCIRFCVTKARKCRAVRKMKVGPSEPPCRERLQTAISCSGCKSVVVNVMGKGVAVTTSSMDWRDERKRTPDDTSLQVRRHHYCPVKNLGNSIGYRRVQLRNRRPRERMP